MQVDTYDGKKSVYNLGSGDSYFIHDFFNNEDSEDLYHELMACTDWKSFTIKKGFVPRRVSVQADIQNSIYFKDCVYPLYRHPVDHHHKPQLWDPSAKIIKEKLEKTIKSKFNHALIQLYRNGKDFISPHSDKTLDITYGTCIANVSLGETRTLVLKSKDKTKKQEIELPDGSLYVIGWNTNIEWLHSIKRNGDPKAKVHPRISLTFRSISTFILENTIFGLYTKKDIYGQGARCKNNKDLMIKYAYRAAISLIAVLIAFNDYKGEYITYMIYSLISYIIYKVWDNYKDANSMQQLFSRMNKETKHDLFNKTHSHDAIVYNHT